MANRKVTRAGVDRAILALERILDAPNVCQEIGTRGLADVDRARQVLLRLWSALEG